MRTSLLMAALLTQISGALLAQQPPTRPNPPVRMSNASPPMVEGLKGFDLDFRGGTPKELVQAIQNALARPLNAIVPDEYADLRMPALKMSNITVQQLFYALEQASHKTQAVETGSYYGGGTPGGYKSMTQFTSSYGFHPGPGPVSDDTIWYFYAEKPALPLVNGPASAQIVRFYSLKPYLDRQLATVDDITTAIETGWKMLGEASPPKISFHKDTKLLIAVGEPNKLEIIDAALKALDEPKASSSAQNRRPPQQPTTSGKSAEASESSGGR